MIHSQKDQFLQRKVTSINPGNILGNSSNNSLKIMANLHQFNDHKRINEINEYTETNDKKEKREIKAINKIIDNKNTILEKPSYYNFNTKIIETNNDYIQQEKHENSNSFDTNKNCAHELKIEKPSSILGNFSLISSIPKLTPVNSKNLPKSLSGSFPNQGEENKDKCKEKDKDKDKDKVFLMKESISAYSGLPISTPEYNNLNPKMQTIANLTITKQENMNLNNKYKNLKLFRQSYQNDEFEDSKAINPQKNKNLLDFPFHTEDKSGQVNHSMINWEGLKLKRLEQVLEENQSKTSLEKRNFEISPSIEKGRIIKRIEYQGESINDDKVASHFIIKRSINRNIMNCNPEMRNFYEKRLSNKIENPIVQDKQELSLPQMKKEKNKIKNTNKNKNGDTPLLLKCNKFIIPTLDCFEKGNIAQMVQNDMLHNSINHNFSLYTPKSVNVDQQLLNKRPFKKLILRNELFKIPHISYNQSHVAVPEELSNNSNDLNFRGDMRSKLEQNKFEKYSNKLGQY